MTVRATNGRESHSPVEKVIPDQLDRPADELTMVLSGVDPLRR
jgi:hypothetical protein